jgi:glutamate synthase (NADPH/NADH) small chain
MGKDTGFLEFKKESPPLRPVEERVRDFQEYDTFFPEEDLERQASRCMDCGVPFCHMGCPLGNMIPDWNELVYRGHWKEALAALHSTNNFPEFTGRICPAPCEDACVLNEHYTLDEEEKKQKVNVVTIEEIEKHIAERGWSEGWIKPLPPEKMTDKRIAIVGSGPAGLAAAQQLQRVGQLRAEGVEFRTGVNVGVDYSVEELRGSFDAILLSTGAQHARKLLVEGSDLAGIHYAMDYLPQRNREVAGDSIAPAEKIESVSKKTIIIGGGFTAADCLGNLNRQGADPQIHQFELVDMVPRPTPVHKEANPDCRANILTESISDDGHGRVKALQAVNVEWKVEKSESSSGGRMTMQRVAGSEFSVPADLIFLAMGFLGPKVEGLLEELGVELNVRGAEKTSSPEQLIKLLKKAQPMFDVYADDNFMTSEDGVFVAGDANRGASIVVWAIWEGREAARCIDKYLMGSTNLPTTPQAEVLV